MVNFTVVGVRRDHWSHATSLLMLGHLELVAHLPFEYPQGWRLHNLCQGLVAPKCLLRSNIISCVSVCDHCLLSLHWMPLRSAWHWLLYTPSVLGYLQHLSGQVPNPGCTHLELQVRLQTTTESFPNFPFQTFIFM